MKKLLEYCMFICIVLIEIAGSSSLLNVSLCAIYVLPILGFVYNMLDREKMKIKVDFNLVLLFFYYFIIVVSLLYTYNFESSFKYVLQFGAVVLFIIFSPTRKEFWIKFIKILFYASISVGITILITTINKNFFIDYFKFLLPKSKSSLEMYYSELRQGIYSGICFERAYAAFCLNIGIMAFLALYYSNVKFKKVDIIGVIILFIALFCTGKRTLFMIPIISFIILGIINNKNKKFILNFLKLLPIIIVILIIVMKFVPSASKVFDRFNDVNSSSTMNTRKEDFWKYAIKMFDEKSLLGYGVRTFKVYIGTIRNNHVYDVHNIYLQVLAENGLVGFTIFITFVVSLLVSTFKIFNKSINFEKKVIINFVIAMQILFLIYGFTGNDLYYYSQYLFYLSSVSMILVLKGEFKNEENRNNNIPKCI